MSKKHHPKRGSKGYSPRKRAKGHIGRFSSWPDVDGAPRIQGFAGYKAGMTHAFIRDYREESTTAGQEVSIPVTIIEVPAMKVVAVRLYRSTAYGLETMTEFWTKKMDKELTERVMAPKKVKPLKNIDKVDLTEVEDVRVIAVTQPKLVTGIPKKITDVMELRISGTDLVEAARSGLQFRRHAAGDKFVLTSSRPAPVMAMDTTAPGTAEVMRTLRLVADGRPYYALKPGTRIGPQPEQAEAIALRTRSLLKALLYLSKGVEVPSEHVEAGIISPDWPAGFEIESNIDDFFKVCSSQSPPKAEIEVRYRGHWFYVDDTDMVSRVTFLHLAELFRLGRRSAGAGDHAAAGLVTRGTWPGSRTTPWRPATSRTSAGARAWPIRPGPQNQNA